MWNHEVEKHIGTKQKCTECDFSNHFSSKIRKHFKLIHLKIPRRLYSRSCDECDFKTEMVKGWDSLKHHKESVHEGIVYTCKICPNYKTNNHVTFRHHNNNCHSKKERKVCTEDDCSYQTSSSRELARHKGTIHEGIIRHRCDTCNKGFLERRSLVNHTVQHTGTFPFNCDMCKKGFMTRWVEFFTLPVNCNEHIWLCFAFFLLQGYFSRTHLPADGQETFVVYGSADLYNLLVFDGTS